MRLPTKGILNSVSQRFHLDTAYFLRGSFWGSIQQVFGVISGLFISYLFGHYIPKSLYGEYNLIISYISLFAFVTLPGIDTALIRSVGQGFDNALIQGVEYKFKYSLIGTLILFGISIYFAWIDNLLFSKVLLITAVLFPFIYSFDVFADFLTAKKQFRTYAIIAIFSSGIFILLHSLSIFFIPTLISLTLAYIGGLILPNIIGFFVSRKYIKISKTDPKMFAYGKFLTLTNLLPWTSGHIGNIILAHALGAESLAVYAVAARLLVAVQKNFAVFHKPMTAKLAYQNPRQHQATLQIHALKLLGIGCMLALVLWIITPIYVNFFFGQNYHAAVNYGRWLSLALIPLPITWVLSDMVIFQKNHLALWLGSTIMPTLKIFLYFILIPKMGIGALVFILLLERFTDPLLPILFLSRDGSKNSQ